MAQKKTVTIRHEETGVTSEVMPSSAKAWSRHGWTVVDDGTSETGSTETADDTANEQTPLFTLDKE